MLQHGNLGSRGAVQNTRPSTRPCFKQDVAPLTTITRQLQLARQNVSSYLLPTLDMKKFRNSPLIAKDLRNCLYIYLHDETLSEPPLSGSRQGLGQKHLQNQDWQPSGGGIAGAIEGCHAAITTGGEGCWIPRRPDQQHALESLSWSTRSAAWHQDFFVCSACCKNSLFIFPFAQVVICKTHSLWWPTVPKHLHRIELVKSSSFPWFGAGMTRTLRCWVACNPTKRFFWTSHFY